MAGPFSSTTTWNSPQLPMTTTEELQRLYVKNKSELTKHISEAVGAEAQYFGGDDWFIRWYAAPTGAEGHNGVEHQDVPDEQMPVALDAVMHNLKTRRFNWVTGPQDQDRLDYFLQRKDFTLDEEAQIMAVDLAQHSGRSKARSPAGVRILDIDVSRVGDWIAAWAKGARDEDVQQWTRIYESVLRCLHHNQFRMFVADQGGRTIGTGYIHCFSGLAAIHAIWVVPEWRHRGLGKALVQHAMGQAFSLRYNVATLTASNASHEFFRSQGFVKFGKVKLHVWRPLKNSDCVKKEVSNLSEAEEEGWCVV